MSDRTHAGRRVLVAEDEYILADDLQLSLEEAGLAVVGPFATLQDVLEAIASGSTIDAAILDVNLGGQQVYPAAEALRERQTPVVFVTGYEAASLPEGLCDIPCLSKPIDLRQALEALGL
ncbi:response regulator [Rhizobium cauense]|uniref:response regulator n=1 Tax=Rhizobium cauense TaxID=1166683 RepID=UPI001C6E6919|nr:response regulator [Rhizobium cauense]MBW9114790.1 response regulator [Rhizobium cauense]